MHRTSRYFPLLLLLFALSGCSALIYEIVWYQLLQLAIGSTAVSLGFLLATFMGGLCIGSIWLPRRFRQHPARLFSTLEFGIAILAILVRIAIPLIDRLYVIGAEHGFPSMILRGLVSSICLLPPTILMGASLPAMVRWIELNGERNEFEWATLYGVNTFGAVFGCLLAGFYLLRVYDTTIATFAAAALNLVVGLIAFALSHAPAEIETAESSAPVASIGSNRTIYIAVALSGACALGGEVVWTRLMGMLLGNTTYVFSIILAVFL
ncbi:MAG TPA: hypothetical protein VKS01_04090, partial [Bryobacteraceae bacterium]|nr:hypothetical protein [Bryobacteraceae bacterium]